MDESFEVRCDGECLLNEDTIDLLEKKKLINESLFGVVAKKEQFLVEERNEDQHQELICKTSIEVVEPYVLKL